MNKITLLDKMDLIEYKFIQQASYPSKEEKQKKIFYNFFPKIAVIMIFFVAIGMAGYANAHRAQLLDALKNESIFSAFFKSVNPQLKNKAKNIKNSTVQVNGYQIDFIQYFNEADTGNVMARFLVRKSEEKTLSKQEFREFSNMLNQKIRIKPSRDLDASYNSQLVRDKKENAILEYRMIEGEEAGNYLEVSHLLVTTENQNGEEKTVGKFKIPKEKGQLKEISLVTKSNSLVQKAKISEISAQITFTNYANDFKEKLSLMMLDGTEYIIWDKNNKYNYDVVFGVMGSGNSTRDDNTLNIGFCRMLPVDKIAYVQIDGEKLEVK